MGFWAMRPPTYVHTRPDFDEPAHGVRERDVDAGFFFS